MSVDRKWSLDSNCSSISKGSANEATQRAPGVSAPRFGERWYMSR